MEKKLITVGQLAKEMDVSVRTLQYYDKIGLLKPSAKSDGGNRLYTEGDLMELYQILALKYLGFSLKDIKEQILALDSPTKVAQALTVQSKAIKAKIKGLNTALKAIDALKKEVTQIKEVDFIKYAHIIFLLRQNNPTYWAVKIFDDKNTTLTKIADKFNGNAQDALNQYNKFKQLQTEALALVNKKEAPTSKASLALAKKWWEYITFFTNDNEEMLKGLMQFKDNREGWDRAVAKKQDIINDFLGQILDNYFKLNNIVLPSNITENQL